MSVLPIDSLETPRFAGVPTFMRLPQAASFEGLDGVLIGLPSDSGSPFRTGARFGVNAVRAMSVMLRPINPYRGGINVFERLRLADAGDAAVVPGYQEESLERLEASLTDTLADTPFLEWLPLQETPFDPLSPGGELLCVTLGLLIPCLLGYCVIRSAGRRLLFAAGTAAIGVTLTALSAALSWGPVHAWEWMGVPARVGIWGALALALLMLPLPRRACAAVLLVALAWHLALLNQAPTSAYFAQTLQIWEQGRFIRFYGLGQWLGWLWPYATLLYVLVRVSRRESTP